MPAIDLNHWIADLGIAIARAAAPDPMLPGCEYRHGVTMLAFTVYADGGMGEIRIANSSGDAALDRRAVAKLRRVDPLPAGPAGIVPRRHVAVVSVAERIGRPVLRVEPVGHRGYATA